MSSPSFYSAAGNFISAIKSGVNPRTGLFNVSLPLISLRTGDLAGPGLALNLSYSPLSSEDEGFGRGFTLNLSRYDSRARKLYLSTGEEYRISSSGNAVIQQRFRNFIFKRRMILARDIKLFISPVSLKPLRYWTPGLIQRVLKTPEGGG